MGEFDYVRFEVSAENFTSTVDVKLDMINGKTKKFVWAPTLEVQEAFRTWKRCLWTLSGGWRCNSCTFDNEPPLYPAVSAQHCKMCGIPKGVANPIANDTSFAMGLHQTLNTPDKRCKHTYTKVANWYKKNRSFFCSDCTKDIVRGSTWAIFSGWYTKRSFFHPPKYSCTNCNKVVCKPCKLSAGSPDRRWSPAPETGNVRRRLARLLNAEEMYNTKQKHQL